MCILSKNIDNWFKLDLSDQIIDWLSGVKFPINDNIPKFELNNEKYSIQQYDFLDAEINNLLLLGRIEKAQDKPHCISPIKCVPKKNKTFRLICDLRHVNNYCVPPKFKYEDIDSVIQCVKPKDYMITTDLKDGFHHVPVHSDHRKYLGFKYRNCYYQWTVLPFGHNCSPYIFTKILRPVVKFLRSKGLRVVLYVDDFILFSPQDTIVADRDFLLDTLKKLGWSVNFSKSSLDPELKKEFIGYLIDNSGEKTVVKIPKDRIRKVKKDIKRCLNNNFISARGLARIAGQCVSMCKCVLPAKLLLRNLYRLLNTKNSWSDILYLDKASTSDLIWWINVLDKWNGIVVSPEKVDIQMVTDASSFAWGAWIPEHQAQGFWDHYLAHKHSNYRELYAVLMGLMSFLPLLENKTVQVLSDNVTTVAFLNNMGGSTPDLDQVARKIQVMAMENGIKLVATYLSGVENWKADQLSRMSSTYEWQLHPNLFKLIDRTWGPHHIDRFASFITTQLPIYNSLFWDPGTSGVDALAQTNWGQMNNFVNAPFALLPKVLDVICQQKAFATVIAPKWEGQVWFTRLLKILIDEPMPLPISERTILAIGPRVEPLKNQKWQVFAWRLCGALDYES